VTTSWTRGTAALAKAVMALCRYLGFLVLSGVERPSRLKKRLGWGVIFPRASKGALWGEKVRTVFGSRAEAGFISGGEQLSLRPARRHWWRIRAGNGGRLASLCKHVVLVVKRQLVINLQSRRQKTDISFRMAGGGLHTTDRYRRIGARSERAGNRQRWGGRPIPWGEWRRIVPSAAFARVYLLEKWGLGSNEVVKMKPSHFR